MPGPSGSNTLTPADRLRDAVADAAVGADELTTSLTAMDVVDSLEIRDGQAIVSVSLPVPAETVRASIERDIADIGADIDGVTNVVVRWETAIPNDGGHVEMLPDVKNLIVVGSGKGGVGKSTVATNLATALAATGADVGLLDADVYGPNAPAMLGLDDRTPEATLESTIAPRDAYGVKVMSMGFIVGEDDPVIWRGPLVDDLLTQLLDDVEWGALDYLFVDLPPGTGDAQLSLVQHLPVTGAVIITTPQAVAVDDARRGLTQFTRYDVPILGIVENMAGFVCPDCDTMTEIFGEGGGQALADEFNIPLLTQLPLDPNAGTDTEPEEATPPGIRVPGIGRLQLPRTQAERATQQRQAPITVRETENDLREALRVAASRVAARTAHLASKQA